MELFTPNAYAEPSTLLFSTSIAPQLKFPLVSSDYAENWPEPLSTSSSAVNGRPLDFCLHRHPVFSKCLSCSFYLYLFRKYVSYGFPIINFCSPRVHYETPYTFSIITRSVLLRMRNVCRTKVVQKIKTHILYSITPPPDNLAVYEIMWKNTDRAGQATDDNMAPAHCMLGTKGCNTYSEYVILISLSLQQRLHERA